jgi:Protein of unknown function (DUF2934)
MNIELKEKMMSTRILNLTIPERPGFCAGAMADPRTTNPLVEGTWREKLIRDAAYLRFLARPPGFGNELEDWLGAEHEVDASLGRSQG